jgi:DNA-directed RNA polymerase sigma subunit (sigma70/sigma32)
MRIPPAREDPGIGALIGRLAPAQQRVLTLRFVFDMAAVDIGTTLGMTTDAVRHAQQRALRSLARDPALVPPRKTAAGTGHGSGRRRLGTRPDQ